MILRFGNLITLSSGYYYGKAEIPKSLNSELQYYCCCCCGMQTNHSPDFLSTALGCFFHLHPVGGLEHYDHLHNLLICKHIQVQSRSPNVPRTGCNSKLFRSQFYMVVGDPRYYYGVNTAQPYCGIQASIHAWW